MKIVITDNPQDLTYTAKVWDGPDGCDYTDFLCGSLGEVFEKIIEFRCLNARSYYDD